MTEKGREGHLGRAILHSEKTDLLDAIVPSHTSRTANSMRVEKLPSKSSLDAMRGEEEEDEVLFVVSIPFDCPEFRARA